MSRFKLVCLGLLVLFLPLLLPQPSFAEISQLDQSQFTQSQLAQSHNNQPRAGRLAPGRHTSYFPVYLDTHSHLNHFYPTGLAGDRSDVLFNLAYRTNTHSGKTCVRIDYKSRGSQGAFWAAMYWQNPAYNWGYKNGGGYNLSGASKLVFWARGEKGGEVIDQFTIGGAIGTYGDSAKASIGPVVLTNEWQKHEISLEGADLSFISSGFSWVISHFKNPEGAVFYLDDIYYI